MTLYEFTYTDGQNLSEFEILQRLEDFLSSEADLQSWTQGYHVRQAELIKPLPNGQRQITFEVIGSYADILDGRRSL